MKFFKNVDLRKINVLSLFILSLFVIFIILYILDNINIFIPKNCEGFKEGKDEEEELSFKEKVYKHSADISSLKEGVDKLLLLKQDVINLNSKVDSNTEQINALSKANQENATNNMKSIIG
tara:strand:+ start:972 stop:1334 length:363 start_codon:yes stop_codon:yes gene_type:complete